MEQAVSTTIMAIASIFAAGCIDSSLSLKVNDVAADGGAATDALGGNADLEVAADTPTEELPPTDVLSGNKLLPGAHLSHRV